VSASFAERVRRELVERPPRRTCCRRSFLSGLIRHAGTLEVSSDGLAVRVETADPAAARLAFGIIRSLGADAQIASFREPRFERRNRVLVRVEGGHGLQLMHEIGVLSAALEPLAEPPRRVIARPCCRASYLRGGFVAAGSVSGPRSAGHLEIRARDADAADVVVRIAAEEGVSMAVARRASHAAAYAKSKATIRDLLALIGAHDAVLAFEEAAVIAGTRERANRVTNFDRANLVRLGGAARAQRDAIAALDLTGLDPRLRQVAELRLRNPHLSLAELGRQARPPLSKSTVAGRMRTLTALTSRRDTLTDR
jgi:cell division protein WhiA